jgi:hypothetical protein
MAPAPAPPSDPNAAQIVTSDLGHFWTAYGAGGFNGSATAFQRGYLDIASGGLTDFANLRGVTAYTLGIMISSYPRYFAAIRENNLRLMTDSTVAGRIRANYAIIRSLYPPSVFPPVTFLIGRFSTAGTTSPNGMLIGTEFYSRDANTPLDELQPFQRDNVQFADDLPVVVAHEHTHILQARAGGLINHANKTLLEQALMEGSADFVGERSSGGNINARLFSIALPQEAQIWSEFRAAMHGTDVSQWLYNQGSTTVTPDRPGDLGYFVGYRISQAYYNAQGDKMAALRDIIEMRNADDFLTRSGYAP